MKNMATKDTVTLNIVNLLKVDSLYNEGMKPCVFSKKQMQKNHIGWTWGGFDISYRKNDNDVVWVIDFGVEKKSKTNYTLTFKYSFTYKNDTVFFAHFYPYTLSDLEIYLAKHAIAHEKL